MHRKLYNIYIHALNNLISGNIFSQGSLSACEFLMLNGAKLDRRDKKLRTPLHHATMHGNTGQVCQFLKRGSQLDDTDADGNVSLNFNVRQQRKCTLPGNLYYFWVTKFHENCSPINP
jgi:ankyrin repeat protein